MGAVEGTGSRATGRYGRYRVCDADRLPAVERTGPSSMPADPKPPILVTGAPRTGTTFLGTMLSLNRNVANIYEPTSVRYGLRDVPPPMLYVRAGSRAEPIATRMFD